MGTADPLELPQLLRRTPYSTLRSDAHHSHVQEVRRDAGWGARGEPLQLIVQRPGHAHLRDRDRDEIWIKIYIWI